MLVRVITMCISLFEWVTLKGQFKSENVSKFFITVPFNTDQSSQVLQYIRSEYTQTEHGMSRRSESLNNLSCVF